MHSNFSVCVYCGSRDGAAPEYAEAAETIGRGLATRGWRLVYGAGDVGLMGRVARAAQAAGGETFGVIPTHLMKLEVGKRDLTTFVITETMHERKKVMAMNADAFVILPGGAGTLDEFFEVLTWRQLGLHEKPIFLLNSKEYWKNLVEVLAGVIQSGFADKSLADMVTVCDNAEITFAALDRVASRR